MSEKEHAIRGTAEPDPWNDQDDVAWYERVNRYLELSARLWRENQARIRTDDGNGGTG